MLFRETVAVYCENHKEHTNPVRTSQETHYVSATETIQLMPFGETVAIYCKNHTEHKTTFCGEKMLKQAGTKSNHWAIKG
jgi:hypothetical protein